MTHAVVMKSVDNRRDKGYHVYMAKFLHLPCAVC